MLTTRRPKRWPIIGLAGAILAGLANPYVIATSSLSTIAVGASQAIAATLLPPGRQQFFDANGNPLSGGTVAFYYPGTTTSKQTWQDAAQTVLNTNPVVLDTGGYATIYGAGAYRQVVKDQAANLIWDQVTADTSSSQIAWGGTSTGTANAQVVSATNFTSADGQIVGFIAGFTNTGQLSVSANGSGAIPVLTDTLSGSVNLSGQEVRQGAAILLIYDANRGAFHLVGGSGGASGAGFGSMQNLPAANVVDLGLVNTHNVGITGNGTISSFGTSASSTAPLYRIFAIGAAALQSSASLIVPQGTLYLLPGDNLIVAYGTDSVWRVVAYTPNTGTAAPAGQVGAFAMNTCPAGWLAADGSAVSRSQYPALFAALQTSWGPGDGSTTFAMPDLRGQFLRGIDNGAGVDAGRTFPSAQGDTVGPHTHSFQITTATVSGTNTIQYPTAAGTTEFPTNQQSPAGTTETRPKNITVLYCVKF